MFTALDKETLYAVLGQIPKDYQNNFFIEDVKKGREEGEDLIVESDGHLKQVEIDKVWNWLEENVGNVRLILHDFGMSDHHIGGDDVISAVDDVLRAQQDGYSNIITWYGDSTEVLILGIKPGKWIAG